MIILNMFIQMYIDHSFDSSMYISIDKNVK